MDGPYGDMKVTFGEPFSGPSDPAKIMAARREEVRQTKAHKARTGPTVPLVDGEPFAYPTGGRLSAVERKPVTWLWQDRIALGKITLVAGDPGTGKSMMSLDLAARISSGRPFPDGTECPFPGGTGVIILSNEDDVADTIAPRLHAAGADMDRCVHLRGIAEQTGDFDDQGGPRYAERDVDLSLDLKHVTDSIRKTMAECHVLIIDPLSAYMGSETDSHRNADVRRVLGPIKSLAESLEVAVIGIEHLNKRGQGAAIYRVQGSIGFAGQSRAVWAVCKDRHDTARRLFLPVKNNLGPDEGTGLAYTIMVPDGTDTPVVAWESHPVECSADEALGAGDEASSGTAKDEAVEWLGGMLENGQRPVRQLQADAKKDGHSWRTIERAKTDVGVKSRKGTDGLWSWELLTAT